MRLVVLLLLFGALLSGCLSAQAQDQNRPFLKVSHIGPETEPIYGLFLCARASALDDKLALAPGYRAEPVYLVPAAELARLQALAQTYAPGQPNVGCRHPFGTLRITINDGRSLRSFLIMPLDDSLEFISELADVLARYRGPSRRHPELPDAVQELRRRLSM
jgi:hypothetical protein